MHLRIRPPSFDTTTKASGSGYRPNFLRPLTELANEFDKALAEGLIIKANGKVEPTLPASVVSGDLFDVILRPPTLQWNASHMGLLASQHVGLGRTTSNVGEEQSELLVPPLARMRQRYRPISVGISGIDHFSRARPNEEIYQDANFRASSY